jgi:mannose-1-phosphate guanylyltransferase
MKAVIQAGGRGTRLRPYSLILPKPLMPIGELPVIELLLKWLRRNDLTEVYVTVGYLGHLIRTVCGNGKQWDMDIIYSEEPEPLGTVGPLHLIKKNLNETFIMLNGDILTDLDLNEFIEFHRSKKGMVTVAVATKDVKIDLGIIDSEQTLITNFREKPTLKFHVSMGIYCLEPEIIDIIPKGVPFGFDDLMRTMLSHDLPVYVYGHNGFWMDIGRPEDFKSAQIAFKDNQASILGY